MDKNLFLKKKNFDINILKNEIAELNSTINDIENEIDNLTTMYINRENCVYNDIISLASKDIFLTEILKEIKNLKNKKEEILKTVQNKKLELSKLLAEKRAYEKYLEKKERERKIKEYEKENQDANESFIRKFYNYK